VITNAQKIREIQDDKESFVSNPEKATHYTQLAEIEGEMHKVEILLIKKQDAKMGKAGKHQKKASTYGKSQMEII
jgi:hypothetical protein